MKIIQHKTLQKSCWEKERRETKSFGWTVIQKATELELTDLKFNPTVPLPAVPPWVPEATVDLTLLEKKNKDSGFILKSPVRWK